MSRDGVWTTPPVAARMDGSHLLVSCAEGSDAWRTTSYGFVHDDAHALVLPLAREAQTLAFEGPR